MLWMRPLILAVCWYVVPGIIWILASDAAVGLLVSDAALMLRRLGHVAHSAVSGDEALGLLAAEEIDLLLTDVGMGPSMNGWELAERALQLRPELPVILATGWGASIDSDVARGRGIVAILSKPYRQADVEQVLARVPERRKPNGDDQTPPHARAS
jgi:CheY-like chemotaxis protein